MLSQGLPAGAMVVVFSAVVAWEVFGVRLAQVGISAVAGVVLYGFCSFAYFLARSPQNLAKDDMRWLDLNISLGCMTNLFTGADLPNMDPAYYVSADKMFRNWVEDSRVLLWRRRGDWVARFDALTGEDRLAQDKAQRAVLEECRGDLVRKWGPGIVPSPPPTAQAVLG
jgi:hypothetical protein